MAVQEDRPGRTLHTRDRETIRRWAMEREATPATVEGTKHGDRLGVLRLDFPGDGGRLIKVSWDEWFDTFDDRGLEFVYQEQKRDGSPSNFFRLVNPEQEEA
jgi:hypothetical protein